MSKKIIAGAGVVASLAVALAPLATFATARDTASDTHTDTLIVNVPASCAFGSASASIAGVSHAGKASWSATTDDMKGLTPDRELTQDEEDAIEAETGTDPRVRHDSADTFSGAYTVYAGTKEDELAKTTLTVYCNDTTQAYTLTAKLADLKHSTWAAAGDPVIAPNDSYTETVSGYAIYKITGAGTNVGVVESSYDAQDGSEKFAATSETPIAKSPSSGDSKIYSTGDTYTMQYGVGVATNQKAGVYTGTVEYNLYQGI